MKHLAIIQNEFLKESRNWDDLSYEEQKGYLHRHPKSKRRITARPDSNEVNDKRTDIPDTSSTGMSTAAINIANTLTEKTPKSIDDMEITEIDEDLKRITTEKLDPIYAAKWKIKNVEHWIPKYRNVIERLKKFPHEAREYSSTVNSAEELIERYTKGIEKIEDDVSKIQSQVKNLNLAVQDSLSQIDLNDLKEYHLAVITPSRDQSYFIVSKDKEKLQTVIKSKNGSKKIINASNKNSIMGTISPYLTALAVLKLKTNF